MTLVSVDAVLKWLPCNGNRCGSTLMHRLLVAAGVCSLSEPFWIEQLCWMCSSVDDNSQAARLLKACCTIDTQLMKKKWYPAATYFSFNLKGFGHKLIETAIHVFPASKHFYMYRSVVSAGPSCIAAAGA